MVGMYLGRDRESHHYERKCT